MCSFVTPILFHAHIKVEYCMLARVVIPQNFIVSFEPPKTLIILPSSKIIKHVMEYTYKNKEDQDLISDQRPVTKSRSCYF